MLIRSGIILVFISLPERNSKIVWKLESNFDWSCNFSPAVPPQMLKIRSLIGFCLVLHDKKAVKHMAVFKAISSNSWWQNIYSNNNVVLGWRTQGCPLVSLQGSSKFFWTRVNCPIYFIINLKSLTTKRKTFLSLVN
jgi:hypothetical protein